MTVIREPLSFYVRKLEVGTPFASLLYGDGEFRVMMGLKRGMPYTHYQEFVTSKMERELLASLTDPDPRIIRATDEYLLDWDSYQGQDKAGFEELGVKLKEFLRQQPPTTWHDGVFWDTEVREGRLAPLFRALNVRPCALVGNLKLREAGLSFLRVNCFVEVPRQDAYATLNDTERKVNLWLESRQHDPERDHPLNAPVVILCMGLGAIPLACRLLRRWPAITVLDLGSVLDVFVGIGEERGWRREMYSDRDKWQECIRRNTAGV